MNYNTSAPRTAKIVAAAACMGASMNDATVEANFKGVDLDAAHDLQITRFSDIFAAFGFKYRPGNDDEMQRAIRAAFSTSEIPNVLADVAHKFALEGFGTAGGYWRDISRAVPVNDFKAVKGVRLVMGGLLKPTGKGGELEHVALSSEGRDLQAATKGSIVGITREDLINDDLGILADTPNQFGQMAGRTINRDVFGSLSTTAGDYGASTTGALNLDNLAAAYSLAMGIRDSEGNPLGAMPNKILCSSESIIKARSIYQSEQITGGTSKEGRDNVMRGVLEPISSPYLTGSAYWIFNSAFPLVDVAFLGGQQTPIIEMAKADFSQLGIQMRCYYDYGVGKGDLKAALYSTGA